MEVTPAATRLALALLAASVLPRTALAYVGDRIELVAWAVDGRSALLREVHRGPEGGGVLSYEVISVAPPTHTRFALSDDTSPGAGGRPQHIPATLCARRAAELAALLERKGFAGVSASLDRCSGPAQAAPAQDPRQQLAAPPRQDVVEVSSLRTEEVRASMLPPEGDAAGWRLSRSGRALLLSVPGGRTENLGVRGNAPQAYLSFGRLLLVVLDPAGGERLLAGAFAIAPSGRLRRLVP